MKIIKKIGAFVCAAEISVSMVSVMPVVADQWLSGFRKIEYNDLKDDEKKMVHSVKRTAYINKSYVPVHCGDLFTFTTSYLWYRYITVENKPIETKIGYGDSHKMLTLSTRVSAKGKIKDSEDVNVKQICQAGPIEFKGESVKVYGYYHYS